MTQYEINEEKAWALLSAQLSGEADKHQVQALREWTNANPWLKPVMKCCNAFWEIGNQSPVHAVEAQLALERHWKKIEQLQMKLQLEEEHPQQHQR